MPNGIQLEVFRNFGPCNSLLTFGPLISCNLFNVSINLLQEKIIEIMYLQVNLCGPNKALYSLTKLMCCTSPNLIKSTQAVNWNTIEHF